MTRILIIGGYGNFGQFISKQLSQDADIQLIIAGRSIEKSRQFSESIGAQYAYVDTNKNLDQSLQDIKPDIVIHTSGPYQEQAYEVAEACIRHKSHYIDLADGRDFVCHINKLDAEAKKAGVIVISGASSVPCLSSAIIDHYSPLFQRLDSINYAIATAQKTNPGISTTAAILSYTGKAFKCLNHGREKTVYGWQDLSLYDYPEIGRRLLANCDIPDLVLFPLRYPTLKNLNFKAGLEVPVLHIGLWLLSWLVRFKLIKSLKPYANLFHRIGKWFDIFGSDRSALHMELKGLGIDGHRLDKKFYIIAGSGHGPNIPCIPSILLARKIAAGQYTATGAQACVGMLNLEEYLDALSGLNIKTQFD